MRLRSLCTKQNITGISPPQNPADPEWMAWRANHITHLMIKIATAVKAERPDAIISLSPNTPAFSYDKYLQDWPRWLEQGVLDEVVVQIYRQDVSAIAAELADPWLQSLNRQRPISIGLYTGPMTQAKPIQKVKQEVELVNNSQYQGVSFFSWETTLWFLKGGSHNRVYQTFQELFHSHSPSAKHLV